MDTGFAAPGAYSFSIDDFYGNFGGRGSSLIIEAGGFSTMPNQEPFDPFKHPTPTWGPVGIMSPCVDVRIACRLRRPPMSA